MGPPRNRESELPSGDLEKYAGDNGTLWKTRLLEQLARIQSVRAETRSEFRDGKETASKPRMGICVTGQMGRLELTSKLENLVAVNLEKYSIDLVLVLAPPQQRIHFANPTSDPGGRRRWSAAAIAEDVMRRFRERSDVQVFIDDAQQAETPYVNVEYLKVSNKPTLGGARVQSHVRQWLALVCCWEHFSRLEQNGPAYDVFLKIRDDSFVLRWWPIKQADYRSRVVISACLGFGGYNDKVAIIDAIYAETYFTRPAFDYYYDYASLKLYTGNPESLLRAVLDKYRVNVDLVHIDRIPVFTNRLETFGDTSVCLVFDTYKLGASPSCWPKSCMLRQLLFCAKCTVQQGKQINLTHYFSQGEGREQCMSPSRTTCKLHRRRLRRHQTYANS